jgi:hypothetical protein
VAPHGPSTTPLSPRDRGSPVVPNFAVPLNSGMGHGLGREGARTGEGAGVDEAASTRREDSEERPISMTSTNASEGSCYSTVTLISSPPSPRATSSGIGAI